MDKPLSKSQSKFKQSQVPKVKESKILDLKLYEPPSTSPTTFRRSADGSKQLKYKFQVPRGRGNLNKTQYL